MRTAADTMKPAAARIILISRMVFLLRDVLTISGVPFYMRSRAGIQERFIGRAPSWHGIERWAPKKPKKNSERETRTRHERKIYGGVRRPLSARYRRSPLRSVPTGKALALPLWIVCVLAAARIGPSTTFQNRIISDLRKYRTAL
jgi:hypothetical protein